MTKNQNLFVKDSAGNYSTNGAVSKQQILDLAYQLIVPDFQSSTFCTRSSDCIEFLKLALADETKEKFGIIFLSSKLQVITFEIISEGTIKSTYVHPRTVVSKALENNAVSVILAHNHPSGSIEPSSSDRAITAMLKEALATIEVTVLDHIIVGGSNSYSFAESREL